MSDLSEPLSPVETELPDARTTSGHRRASSDDRAFSARSVIASTLLGTRPPTLPVSVLVRSCALFSISAPTARTALARMVASEELELSNGRYTLVGRLRQRQSRQSESRRGAVDKSWDGAWTLRVVNRENRDPTQRARLRNAMYRLRISELYPGTWARPDNLSPTDSQEAEAVVTDQCTTFSGAHVGDPVGLAGQLWNLNEWSQTAGELVDRMHATAANLQLDDQKGLAAAFRLNAAVLRHFQADPLLPSPLLTLDWPGAALRDTFESFDLTFMGAWRHWLHP
jgi:phenylacetic acid degradation operon negative regulatory protein